MIQITLQDLYLSAALRAHGADTSKSFIETYLPMKHEFNIIYKSGEFGAEVFTTSGISKTGAQLREQFEAAGYRIIAINEIRPYLDWTKPNFDREEAAAFLGISPAHLSFRKSEGDIPFAKIGQGIYPRALLEKYRDQQLNDAGKKLSREFREFREAK